jgi:hypothetical protein
MDKEAVISEELIIAETSNDNTIKDIVHMVWTLKDLYKNQNISKEEYQKNLQLYKNLVNGQQTLNDRLNLYLINTAIEKLIELSNEN